MKNFRERISRMHKRRLKKRLFLVGKDLIGIGNRRCANPA